jgi:hypothetical protein
MPPGGSQASIGPAAMRVDWRLGDGSALRLLANFAEVPVPLAETIDPDTMIYCSGPAPLAGELASACAAFFLLPETARP